MFSNIFIINKILSNILFKLFFLTFKRKYDITETSLKVFDFFCIQGPELMNKYVGESERAVREVKYNKFNSTTIHTYL